jgi:hypothetical protein
MKVSPMKLFAIGRALDPYRDGPDDDMSKVSVTFVGRELRERGPDRPITMEEWAKAREEGRLYLMRGDEELAVLTATEAVFLAQQLLHSIHWDFEVVDYPSDTGRVRH